MRYLRSLPIGMLNALLCAVLGACSSSTPTPGASNAGAGASNASAGANATGGSSTTVPVAGASGASTTPQAGNSATSAGGSASTPDAGSGGGDTAGTDAGGTGPGAGSNAGGSAGSNAAGAAGSSSIGGSSSAGAGGCPGLFCEDFESGKIDPNVWDTKTFGGQTVVVQSTQVAHGKYAVQFHAKPNIVSYDFIITKNAPAALSGHHFGRASFYLTPKPPSAHTVYLFSGSSGFPNFKYLEVASTGSTWQLSLVHLIVNSGQATSATGTEETYMGGGTVPLEKWSCIEWEFNDAPDQATVYVAGKSDLAFSSIKLGGVSTGLIGGFTDFGFGFYAWHPASYDFDVYYDDIVLDTKRIGCP